jgi:NADH-quinone oxidoreductase subunit E
MAKDTPQATGPVDFDPQPLLGILRKHQGEKGTLIPILQETQDVYGYLPTPAIEEIAAFTGVPLAQIYGVATFYAQFRLRPVGKHIVRVCCGTACHVAGAEAITDAMAQTLDVAPGDTTVDGLFTLETVACLGCCSLAPVMMIGDETYGRLDEKAVRKIVKEYRKES